MNHAIINGNEFPLTPLESIRVVATQFGFTDVDVEPTGNGGYKVTARSDKGRELPVSGRSLEECCEKFCSSLLT